MSSQNESLSRSLEGATRVAVLGVGSELRGDDGAGLVAIRELERICPDLVHECSLGVYWGSTAPENLTGTIRDFNPSHLVIIDAAMLGLPPGGTRVIARDEIGGVSFSTHRLPMNILIDFISATLSCAIVVVGIQPSQTGLCCDVDPRVAAGARTLAGEIADALRAIPREQVDCT
ncbi:MAG: hydrogenase 3 maturation endopeptidase HyCI [Spirochaetes bacterium]|nr:MAG: hydrogenase 3 maturation endopeptidase HyCI [Spirochaetota bacterium]